MKLQARVISAAAALCLSCAAHAVPTTKFVGTVSVLGTSYDVSVLFDSAGVSSAQSFLALNPTITFTTSADALVAANALMATFGASYDWNPASSATGGSIAYAKNASQYSYVTLNNGLTGGPFVNYAQVSGNNFSFVQFAVSAVPEPASYALALAGLGVVGFTWRRKAAAV